MKKILLAMASAVTIALISGSAYSADPIVEEVFIPPPPPSWGGMYIGAHLGYGWGDRDGCMDVPDLDGVCGPPIPPIPFDYDQSGWLVGGQIGYNYMMSPRWLIGLEVDASFADIDGDTRSTIIGPISQFGQGEYSWLASGKVRLGYAFGATQNWMVYGVAGAGFSGFDYSGNFGCSFDQTRSGWLLGLGGEYRISARASVKAEYNYVDYGSESDTCSVLSIIPAYVDTKATQQLLKVGFNYKIGPQ